MIECPTWAQSGNYGHCNNCRPLSELTTHSCRWYLVAAFPWSCHSLQHIKPAALDDCNADKVTMRQNMVNSQNGPIATEAALWTNVRSSQHDKNATKSKAVLSWIRRTILFYVAGFLVRREKLPFWNNIGYPFYLRGGHFQSHRFALLQAARHSNLTDQNLVRRSFWSFPSHFCWYSLSEL